VAWTILRHRHRDASAEGLALSRLLAAPRYEIIPLKDARSRSESLPPGAIVTITASPSHGIEATIALAEWLQARGFVAIPHLSARMIRDRSHLADLLQRARAAALTEAFVVGGDPSGFEGLRDGITLLRAMSDIGHAFTSLGVPAYPEGHSSIPNDVLRHTLAAKARHAQSMTTQMSFDASAVSSWIVETRAEGVSLPLYIGVPGAVEIRKLMTVAARIGVAGSARYLAKNRRAIVNLLWPRAFAAERFLTDLAPTMATAEAAVAGLHLFTFNQIEETVAWTRRMRDELR
jgi:methylenetetrahydrofolate reductase (NADPH)